MLQETPLIATLTLAFVGASVMGLIAGRLRLPPILGYLLAGVALGPSTPGFTANPELASELAEIGVILLMFGVGLHFSYRDLVKVQSIALPGAIAQIAVATLLGAGLALGMGWPLAGGLTFGLALSVASTVVLVRALEERQLLDTRSGHIAVGWLVVEDLVMVAALVFLPVIAGALPGGRPDVFAEHGGVGLSLAATFGKLAAFVALMILVGRRVIPWSLAKVASLGSRELFTLTVLSMAVGVAYGAAKLFDVSFALGAFAAGMILKESELSHKAGDNILPLRDAFAVLFFVSVGMLFDPGTLIERPLAVLATVLTIVVGKSVAAFLIVRAFRHPQDTAVLIAASLAQIGEFSFILTSMGMSLGILPEESRDLVLAGSIGSILLNPAVF
ncbi:MAG: cation:proton antiporter, partial [Pseudomonadota bacterium]